MRVVCRDIDKVVLEVCITEIEQDGFDSIWDKIRDVYKKDEFHAFSIFEYKTNCFNYPVEQVYRIELIKNAISTKKEKILSFV